VPNGPIEGMFGLDYSTVSAAHKRLRERMQKEPAMEKLFLKTQMLLTKSGWENDNNQE